MSKIQQLTKEQIKQLKGQQIGSSIQQETKFTVSEDNSLTYHG